MGKHNSSRFSIVPARAVEDRRLSAPAFRVLAALGTYSDKDGWCWPSLTTLATQLGTKRPVVHRNVQDLAKLGYLEIKRTQRRDGGNATNRYRLLFDRALFVVRDQLSEAEQEVKGGAVTVAVTGGCHPGGDTLSPPEGYTILTNAPRELDSYGRFAKHFEEFWRKYPSRSPHSNPKKPAKQKFETAAKRGVPVEVIIRGAENYAAYVARETDDARFIAQAVTWLNQERWTEYQKPFKEPVREVAPL